MVQGETSHLLAPLKKLADTNSSFIIHNYKLRKMLNIKRFVVNPLQENCFVVSDETRQCVIIDCGACYADEYASIEKYISDEQLTPQHLLCTHAHFDHCMGNAWVGETYGLRPELGADDESLLKKLGSQVEMLLGVRFDVEMPQPERLLHDGDTISFGSHQLVVKATPGHTPGGLCFYCEAEKVVFTGDTLFRMSMGRTDLEGGNWNDILNSLNNVIATLPPDVTAYCGHGPETTIGFELRYNPILR